MEKFTLLVETGCPFAELKVVLGEYYEEEIHDVDYHGDVIARLGTEEQFKGYVNYNDDWLYCHLYHRTM